MVLEQQALLLAESRLFFFDLKELFCACFARSNLYSAKEKLEIVNARGEAAHFCPATPEPRGARRGNAVRAIFKIHRQLGNDSAKFSFDKYSRSLYSRRSFV
jgi:hypothetical protein